MFSLVDSADATIRFLREIQIISRTHHVSLDLGGVETLTTEAVAAIRLGLAPKAGFSTDL